MLIKFLKELKTKIFYFHAKQKKRKEKKTENKQVFEN